MNENMTQTNAKPLNPNEDYNTSAAKREMLKLMRTREWLEMTPAETEVAVQAIKTKYNVA